jgi:hypothetical protein
VVFQRLPSQWYSFVTATIVTAVSHVPQRFERCSRIHFKNAFHALNRLVLFAIVKSGPSVCELASIPALVALCPAAAAPRQKKMNNSMAGDECILCISCRHDSCIPISAMMCCRTRKKKKSPAFVGVTLVLCPGGVH